MKLYYKAGACSLAPHIIANEADLDVEAIEVDLAKKTTEQDGDFLAINPNGYVPALVLADGEVMTEASVLVQYLADQKPQSGLMPEAGRLERYRVQEWLTFIATELHKSFTPFFKPDTPEKTKDANRALLTRRIGFVDQSLQGRSYLMGETFSAADAYLWTILGWAGHVGFDLSPFENVQRFMATVAARPAVQKTLREEGLA